MFSPYQTVRTTHPHPSPSHESEDEGCFFPFKVETREEDAPAYFDSGIFFLAVAVLNGEAFCRCARAFCFDMADGAFRRPLHDHCSAHVTAALLHHMRQLMFEQFFAGVRIRGIVIMNASVRVCFYSISISDGAFAPSEARTKPASYG